MVKIDGMILNANYGIPLLPIYSFQPSGVLGMHLSEEHVKLLNEELEYHIGGKPRTLVLPYFTPCFTISGVKEITPLRHDEFLSNYGMGSVAPQLTYTEQGIDFIQQMHLSGTGEQMLVVKGLALRPEAIVSARNVAIDIEKKIAADEQYAARMLGAFRWEPLEDLLDD